MNEKNVSIFLFNGFADWEISYLCPEIAKSETTTLKTFTLDGEGVTSMGGLKVIPDLPLSKVNVDDVSVFVLPGGTD